MTASLIVGAGDNAVVQHLMPRLFRDPFKLLQIAVAAITRRKPPSKQVSQSLRRGPPSRGQLPDDPRGGLAHDRLGGRWISGNSGAFPAAVAAGRARCRSRASSAARAARASAPPAVVRPAPAPTTPPPHQ